MQVKKKKRLQSAQVSLSQLTARDADCLWLCSIRESPTHRSARRQRLPDRRAELKPSHIPQPEENCWNFWPFRKKIPSSCYSSCTCIPITQPANMMKGCSRCSKPSSRFNANHHPALGLSWLMLYLHRDLALGTVLRARAHQQDIWPYQASCSKKGGSNGAGSRLIARCQS